MTCLVTGGAGFIGSHLCDELIRLNRRVICIDNLITGRKKNIAHLLENKLFTFFHEDVLKIEKLQLKPDFIFHLASPASPRWYQKFPIETLMVNTLGTNILLKMAKKTGARMFFASTSEVYGEPQKHPQDESYWGNVNPIGYRSCYDEAKRCGEAFAMAYFHTHKVDVRIARIFNTYGPRMDIDDGRAVSNFIYQSLANKPITIYGTGTQTRSFCFISDMVDGIIKMMLAPNLSGEVINLGNPEEIKISQLASLIHEVTKKDIKIEYLPLPKDDPTRRKPVIKKAKKLITWEPSVKLRKGIEQTVAYFQTEYHL